MQLFGKLFKPIEKKKSIKERIFDETLYRDLTRHLISFFDEQPKIFISIVILIAITMAAYLIMVLNNQRKYNMIQLCITNYLFPGTLLSEFIRQQI